MDESFYNTPLQRIIQQSMELIGGKMLLIYDSGHLTPFKGAYGWLQLLIKCFASAVEKHLRAFACPL